jgi:hypothetical protein
MLHRNLVLVLFGVSLAGWGPVSSRTWEGELYGGGRVEVDTATNKPVYHGPEGAQVPLWDGVHQLQDGRTITVRDGVMVPNEQVLDLRHGFAKEEGFVGETESSCEQLVRKVCGFADECSDAPGCAHARQLRQFAREELDERSEPGYSARFIEVPGQCREALRNEELFQPCNKDLAGGKPTPCAKLVAKVCGDRGQCAGRPSCGPAKQLLDREYAERLASPDTGADEVPTSVQCRQALEDDGFFSACSP